MTEAHLNNLAMAEDLAAPETQWGAGVRANDARAPESPANDARASERKSASVGPWLFAVMLIAVMGLFWWLTLYSHGVAPHAS